MSELRSWLWPNLANRRQINIAIQEGCWAAVLAAALIVFSSLIGFLMAREVRQLFLPFLETILFVSLAIGIGRRSRTAAVAALSIYVVHLLMIIPHGPSGLLPAILISVPLLNGVRGTFAYRKLPLPPPGTPSLEQTFETFRKVPIPADSDTPQK